MKTNTHNNYYVRFLAHIIISLVITSTVEVILAYFFINIANHINLERSQDVVRANLNYSGTLVLFGLLITGSLLFGFIFWLLQRRSISYISKISTAMKEISEGKLNLELDIQGDDEFSLLAMNLNRMLEDIRMLMEKERESEKTKNELITNIAHDLRTPLTSILGYLQLLKNNTALSAEDRLKYMDIVYTKTLRLDKLINDLFSFTKLNYGKIALNLSKIDIVKLLEQLMEEFYPNFKENGLTYNLISNVDSCIINADANLLARLFDNLIGNAIKYGKEGKEINVKIYATEDTVSISVINYGQVIPENELPFLFDKFYRMEKSRSSQTGGTGLGLAIAKNIVDVHFGQISVESSLTGTFFIVKLLVNLDLSKENFNYG